MAKSIGAEHKASLLPWPKQLPIGLCFGQDRLDDWADPFEEEQLERAASFCRRCTIRSDCFSIGVERGDSGVYGGRLLVNGKVGDLPKIRRRKYYKK